MARTVEKPTNGRLRIYLRRSRADQDHQRFSIDVQREECHRFALNSLPGRGLTPAWMERKEYVDEGRSGDDFDRPGLVALRKDVQAGDVIVCRDHTRLGRDAIESMLIVRAAVQERGARLFYTATGQEVTFGNVIDQAVTFIQGIGGQMELEANRSRTREALRNRVRQGRIAGGRCYGYSLERCVDGSGRPFTIAKVNDAEAVIIRRIFEEYAGGRGLKKIAIGLNEYRVPPPQAGRRGTGSWAPSAIRPMLFRDRYRGVYVHGRIVRVKEGGRRVTREAPSSDWINVEIPDWRIVTDEIWITVQEKFAEALRQARDPGQPGRAQNHRYALSGTARCRGCGGPIGSMRVMSWEGKPVPAYGCVWHNTRGSSVCPIKIRQPIRAIEAAFAESCER